MVERHKVCNRCGVKKGWSEFYAKVKWPDGTMRRPQSRCKACFHELTVEWEQANRDKKRAAARRYREKMKGDPERLAARRARQRDWQVRKRGRGSVVPDGGASGYVDAGPLLALVREHDVTYADLAARMGLKSAEQLSKSLRRGTVTMKTALGIAAALGLDPVDVGL